MVTLIPARGSHLSQAEWPLLCRLLEEMKWSLRPRPAHCARHKGLSVWGTSFKCPLGPRGLETPSPRPPQDLPGFCFQRTSSERQGPLMSLKLAFPCRVTPARPAGGQEAGPLGSPGRAPAVLRNQSLAATANTPLTDGP